MRSAVPPVGIDALGKANQPAGAQVLANASRDSLGYTVAVGGGNNDERMIRDRWDVGALLGCRAWIRVVDMGTGPWCHINVDDIRFHD